MCTWCRPRELISPVSFFTLLYQRILHENRVFLFLYIFPVAKRQLMGELTCGMGSTCSELRVSQDTFCGDLVLKNSNWPDFSLVFTLIWSVQRSVIKTWCLGLTWSNQDFALFESELVFELFGRMSIKSGQTTPTRSWLPDSLIADYWVFIF